MWDYKQTAEGDIDLTAGDLLLVEPTHQHQRDLLIAAQGSYKETPEAGVDSVSFIHDPDPSNYLRTIRKQFTRDGMRIKDVTIDERGNLEIKGGYADN